MNIEATAKLIMSARHSDAFDREACEQILRDAYPERLADLVRFCRAELHEAGLITDDEYAELVTRGSEGARRLERYAAQPKPESWQEIARECAIVIVNTTAAKTEELGDIQRLVNSCIERSHAAQKYEQDEK